MNYVALGGDVGAWMKEKEGGGSDVFSLASPPFFLEILPLGGYLALEQDLCHGL